MQLPIDVKAVIDEAMDIEGARTTPLSVSVYIDDSAPGDLIGHVRSAFASASAHTRVTIGYLDERPMAPFPGDDMAVLVAGLSERIGEHAAALRAAGVPVMVATTLPRLVESIAEAAPARVAYVSCNPATWARDVARFEQNGYRLARAQPVDLFPQTHHVEVASLFERE